MTIRHLAFLTPGNYSDDDPAAGLEAALALLAGGEALGYDSGWVRQRHLERGVSSATAVLAAATQRTRRIQWASRWCRWATSSRSAWPRTWPRWTCCRVAACRWA